MAPGMAHCGGGTGPNTFDMQAALEQWVERGVAPERIVATRGVNGVIDRLRPLCPYPQVAVYKGQGDTNDAANFECRAAPGAEGRVPPSARAPGALHGAHQSSATSRLLDGPLAGGSGGCWPSSSPPSTMARSRCAASSARESRGVTVQTAVSEPVGSGATAAPGNLTASGAGIGRSGIGFAVNRRRQGPAIRRAHRLARFTRALSVAMPVFAYICRYSFEISTKADARAKAYQAPRARPDARQAVERVPHRLRPSP